MNTPEKVYIIITLVFTSTVNLIDFSVQIHINCCYYSLENVLEATIDPLQNIYLSKRSKF